MSALLKIPLEFPTREDTCEKHGQFVSQQFMGKVWSRCPKCNEEERLKIAEQEEAVAAAKRLEAWKRKIGGSGIPDRFHDRTLKSFTAETPAQERALAFCQQYAAGFAEILKTGRSALFIGKPGTGKTHLACGIALQIMREQSRTVLFTTVMRAIRRIKESWSRYSDESESQVINRFTFPDLLIMDEVGIQFGSEFERNILFDILNERYEKRRPTILMSNLPKDQVMAYLGERVMDRLREDNSKMLVFDWESHRKVIREKAQGDGSGIA